MNLITIEHLLCRMKKDAFYREEAKILGLINKHKLLKSNKFQDVGSIHGLQLRLILLWSSAISDGAFLPLYFQSNHPFEDVHKKIKEFSALTIPNLVGPDNEPFYLLNLKISLQELKVFLKANGFPPLERPVYKFDEETFSEQNIKKERPGNFGKVLKSAIMYLYDKNKKVPHWEETRSFLGDESEAPIEIDPDGIILEVLENGAFALKNGQPETDITSEKFRVRHHRMLIKLQNYFK